MNAVEFPSAMKCLPLLATCFTVFVSMAQPAQGATFVVDSIGDEADASPGNGVCATSAGVCTLRAAIAEANATPDLDNIHFGLASGPQQITVASSLPTIASPVLIDGWTQAGFTGLPLVTLNGDASSGNGLTIAGGGTTVRGLVIQRFGSNGIRISGSGGNVVEGNYIGTDATGAAAAANGDSGIYIDNSPNNRIGGNTVVQRNVISGNIAPGHQGGIVITGGGASGNLVQGNYIGTDATGTGAMPNGGRGVAISNASNNLVGGPGPGEGNLISGNHATGVRVLGGSATGNIIQRNIIGTDRTGRVRLGNDRGVQLRSSNNQVLGNYIAGNRNNGVTLLQDSSGNLVKGNLVAYNGFGPYADPLEQGFSGIIVAAGSHNTLSSNSVFNNADVGIDLFDGVRLGVTPDDDADLDVGANDLQNFPALTSALRSATATSINGTLRSHPSQPYTLEFFANEQCDASGYGEGRFALAQTNVTSDSAGNVEFLVVVPFGLPAGWVVTATATDGAGNTSEFSACVVVK